MNDPHLNQNSPPSGFKLLGRAVLLCLAALGVAYKYSATLSVNASAHWRGDVGERRHLSTALAAGGCEVTRAPPSSAPVSPAWQASYPGSGARMTLFLVEALTGIATNSDFDPHGTGYERVSTVKTHYPVNNQKGFPKLDEEWPFERAVVLMRHPKDAIPSLFNLHYEQMHHLPNHSTRAPQPEWLKYRNNREAKNCNVFCELEKYEQFFDYWMTKYDDRSRLHVFSYEDMTGEETGPRAAATLASFLGQTDGVAPIADESIPCVWETVVNYKNHIGELNFKVSSLREGPTIRAYTPKMLREMLTMLERLKLKYGEDEEFARILDGYIETTLTEIDEPSKDEEGFEEVLGLDERWMGRNPHRG